MRPSRKLVLAGLALVSLAGPAIARAQSPIARPNPVFVGVRLDYVEPLRSSTGGIAQLSPLDPAVIKQAIIDQSWLTFLKHDDLGGFNSPTIGQSALSSGGRAVVGLGAGVGVPQIPHFAGAAGGQVNSFAFTGGPPAPPDNGTTSVPGLGVPPPVAQPGNTNNVPPPNQGFGGVPTPPGTRTTTTTGGDTVPTSTSGPGTRTTTPTTTTRPPTTTTTTTTPTTTATSPPPTTTIGGGGGAPPPTSCGTAGLQIESNLTNCRIYAINMAPGGATYEQLTITNTSGQDYTVSMKATGSQNPLWNDLQLGIWEIGTPAPSPLPSLLLWTTQYNDITPLAAGQSIHLQIELYLPTSAGNGDQGRAAAVDFNWRATA
jgi:hypothetical protein